MDLEFPNGCELVWPGDDDVAILVPTDVLENARAVLKRGAQ